VGKGFFKPLLRKIKFHVISSPSKSSPLVLLSSGAFQKRY
jgi:hypothetical protein